LVFLDECGTHLAHTRAYGRAPRGGRAVGRVPRNRGRVTTLLASLTPTGTGPARTRLGGTTKEVFLAYLREEVAPTLAAGQVVVLDNLGAHRAHAVRALVEATGARLVYLPSYSPDFNPIELAFGKLKASLRRAGARTREGLEAAIGDALAAVTPADVRGYYAHCGYSLPGQP
jgi:transposase